MRPLFLFFLLLSSAAFGQAGYQIDFVVKGWKDTTVNLGYYMGEGTYLKDTARVSSKGAFRFDGKQKLPQGVYFLVMNKTKLFDIVIGEQQLFRMETSADDPIRNMVVTGDVDNKIFFDNLRHNGERHQEAEPFIKILNDSTLTPDQKKEAAEAFNRVNDKVVAYQNQLVDQYPKTVTARVLKAMRPLKSPELPKRADGKPDSSYLLKYYREHFFDDFDLADDALLRLPRPFYAEKIKEYLERLYAPQPDTIIRAIHLMVAKANKNPETYKFLVWNCLYNYQNPEIMGLDAVYVRLYDEYFASGEMDYWIDKKLKQNVKTYADRLRLSLIGNTALNLIMQDENLQPRSMYDIKKKYTVLFIFDPDCGHCRQETPKLVEFYNKNKVKLDVEVFAVSVDTSMKKMRDFIKEFKMTCITVNGPRTYVGHHQKLYDAETTPSLYVIDNKRKIIGKKLPVEKLEEFLTRYESFQKQGAPPSKTQ
ncbi:MAG: redoxin domain-containing protein [Cyclobacteriaceae bacterium]